MSGHLERSQQRRSSGSQSLPQSANSLRSSRNAQRPSASTAHNSSDEPQSPRNENALDHLPVDKETPKRRASRASKSIQRAHDIERDVNDGDDKGVVVDEQMIEQMEKEIEKSTQEIDRLLSKTESRLSRQRSKIQERRQRKSSNNNSASSPGLEMEQDQDQEQQQEDGRPLLHKNHDHDVPLLPRPTDPSPRIPPRRASHSMSSQEGQLVGGHASQKDAVNTKEKRRSSGLLASSPRNSVSLSPSASRRSSVSQSQDNGSSNSPTSHDAISTEQHGTKRLSHKRTSNEAMVSHEDGGKRKVSLSEIPIRDKGDVDAEMAVKSVFSAYANIANDTQVHSGRRGSKRRSSKGMESGNKSHGNRKSSTNSIHIDVAASMDEDHHPQSYLSEEDFVTLVRDSGLIPSSPSSSSSPSGLTRVDNAIGRTARQVFSLALVSSIMLLYRYIMPLYMLTTHTLSEHPHHFLPLLIQPHVSPIVLSCFPSYLLITFYAEIAACQSLPFRTSLHPLCQLHLTSPLTLSTTRLCQDWQKCSISLSRTYVCLFLMEETLLMDCSRLRHHHLQYHHQQVDLRPCQ